MASSPDLVAMMEVAKLGMYMQLFKLETLTDKQKEFILKKNLLGICECKLEFKSQGLWNKHQKTKIHILRLKYYKLLHSMHCDKRNLIFANINSVDDHFNTISHLLGKDTYIICKCEKSIAAPQFRNHLSLFHWSHNYNCVPLEYQDEFNYMLINSATFDLNNSTLTPSYRFQINII